MSTNLSLSEIAGLIDHSLLHPTLTDAEIIAGCEVAKKHHTATVCVKPAGIQLASGVLKDSGVGICSVVSFPHGSSDTAIKVRETERDISSGATEIDMVVNIGKVLGGAWDYVAAEIQAVNDAAVYHTAIVKVIFETDFLDDKHIIKLCEICSEKQVAFVKTSTGYGFSKLAEGNYTYLGATERCFKLMKKHLAPTVKIKAAGNIRTIADVLKFVEWGATRIGASATESILLEARHRGIK